MIMSFARYLTYLRYTFRGHRPRQIIVSLYVTLYHMLLNETFFLEYLLTVFFAGNVTLAVLHFNTIPPLSLDPPHGLSGFSCPPHSTR